MEPVELTGPQHLSLILDMSSKTQTSLKNEARLQSDERWRAAFENSAIGIMMTDVNGRYFAANRAFHNILGYSERELHQLTFLDVTYLGNCTTLCVSSSTFRCRESVD